MSLIAVSGWVAREIQAFFEHVSSLQFADKPDYAALRAILRRMRKQGVSKSVDLGFERSCARVRKVRVV